MSEDLNSTLDDIDEMVREQYVCSLGAYDEVLEDYEITWTNAAGRECGFFGSRQLIGRMFSAVVLN